MYTVEQIEALVNPLNDLSLEYQAHHIKTKTILLEFAQLSEIHHIIIEFKPDQVSVFSVRFHSSDEDRQRHLVRTYKDREDLKTLIQDIERLIN